MTDQTPQPSPVPGPQSDSLAPRKKRGSGKRGGRGPDGVEGGRQQRPRADKPTMAGFGDGIERAVCTAIDHTLPASFPATHRTGMATVKLAAVARTEAALLLCDGTHDGPHRWPNGDIVDEESGAVVDMLAELTSTPS